MVSPSTTDSATKQKGLELGFQKRYGDEIMVCGQHYRIGTPVVLWTDPKGFDAYRTDRRFSPFEDRKWKTTVEEMKAGRVDFVSKPQETSPERYGMRFEANAANMFGPEKMDQLRGGGWDLETLQQAVDQFVLHFDVCGTSAQCFYILHDKRGLSVHFMLDADGTIYQTLDLKERAWHATKSNDRSIGIEIANIGAYPVGDRKQPFLPWYKTDPQGVTILTFPDFVRGRAQFENKRLSPRRAQPVSGVVQGKEFEQYDFTPEQYTALIKLTAGLCDIFPKIQPDAPRDPDGQVIRHALNDDQWATFGGVLGHYHIQTNKTDPGPAMDWEFLLSGVRERMKQLEEQ